MPRYFTRVLPMEIWDGTNVDAMVSFLNWVAPALTNIRRDVNEPSHLLAEDSYPNTITFELGDSWVEGNRLSASDIRSGFREV